MCLWLEVFDGICVCMLFVSALRKNSRSHVYAGNWAYYPRALLGFSNILCSWVHVSCSRPVRCAGHRHLLCISFERCSGFFNRICVISHSDIVWQFFLPDERY